MITQQRTGKIVCPDAKKTQIVIGFHTANRETYVYYFLIVVQSWVKIHLSFLVKQVVLTHQQVSFYFTITSSYIVLLI